MPMSQPIRRKKRKEVDIVSPEALTDELLLSITTSTLAEYLILTPDDTSQSEDVLNILTYASVKQISLEEACHQLEDAPSPNTVRNRLNESVLSEIETLEENINAALVSQWPKAMTKKAHYVIKRNKRITLAMTYVRGSDSLVEILERLLTRLEESEIRCRSLLLDKEFYTVAVIRYLKRKVSSFIIPIACFW